MATAQQEIKALKEDLADLKKAVADQAEEAVEDAETSRFDVQEMKARARLAGIKARKFFEDKQGQMKVARDKTEKTIKERPFASTAAAFAGGALVATLISRK
ncbi:MAG: hypothetical protein HWE25_07075 [Alphaproteobacteria bacterium]|nr:hypothetical protein [Alphaproteobacteria bacterium]